MKPYLVFPSRWKNSIPASTIAALSSREFVGMVADDPDCKIELKAFHAALQNDNSAIKKEQAKYQPLPVIGNVNSTLVQQNYLQVKRDVEYLVMAEMERILGDPSLAAILVRS